jgi:hypothetical protein
VTFPGSTGHEFRYYGAFAALRSDGSVVTWGDQFSGGNSTGVDFNGITNNLTASQIFSTGNAFAALLSDGSVVTWGDPNSGGNSTGVNFHCTNNNLKVSQIFSTGFAFAALRSDGSVVTWGDQTFGGNSSSVADVINDTWAGHDPALPEVAAEFGAGLVCSHTGGAVPRTRPFRVNYGTTVTGVVDDVIAEVTTAAERAVAAGVRRDGILIDPTHDFGKNTFHGLTLLRHVRDLVDTGWPVLMALSNKDFIGETLGAGLTERLEGTLAATALAAADGARAAGAAMLTHRPAERQPGRTRPPAPAPAPRSPPPAPASWQPAGSGSSCAAGR